MIGEAIEQYKDTMSRLLQKLSNFSQKQINKVPYADSWTPGEVADHVLKSQYGLPDLLKGKAKPANREPCEKVDAIKQIFLDFTSKLNSPAYILPTNDPVDKITIINSLSNKSADIIDAFQSLDPTEECLDFELPVLGVFTRLEWLYFATYHTQRHIWQLSKMQ